MNKVCLLSIDPQKDFCDPNGALYVNGAEKDMERLATMLKRTKGDIDEIFVTLDSHRTVHIAHPIWWVDKDGNHPDFFTPIGKDDVIGLNAKWRAYNSGYQKRSEEYVQKLADNGRYDLCIWPPHCRIGSDGAQVMPIFYDALCDWENRFASVNYVTKGSNIYTEHYSAVKADVYDDEDPSTGLNSELIRQIQKNDIIAISGEASSHCVYQTILDIANEFGEDNIKKFVFLEDTSSPVTGFEHLQTEFLEKMVPRGMSITTSDKFLA